VTLQVHLLKWPKDTLISGHVMKKSAIFLVVAAGLASAAYLYRDELAPYLPASMSAYLGAATKTDAPPSATADAMDIGKGGKKGSGRGNGGGPVAVLVAEAKAGSLPITRGSFGYIQAKAVTPLASPIAGIVTDVLVTDGAEVKKGDIIVTYDDRSLKAALDKDTATLAKDQVVFENAKLTEQRTTNLGEKGASTQQSVDNAVAAVQQAEAALAVDKAQIEADQVAISNAVIKAPYDGQLGQVLVSKGAYVSAGTSVASLVNLKESYAQFTLPEADLKLARAALSEGTLTASVSPTSASDGTTVITGPVAFIDNSVDQASGTFKLWASIDNSAKTLWPGESVTVTATAGEIKNLVLVPGVAIAPAQDGMVAYVVNAQSKIEIRKVTVALRNNDTAGISEGLKPGDKVVIEGQQNLAKGATVKIEDAAAKASGKAGGKAGGKSGGKNKQDPNGTGDMTKSETTGSIAAEQKGTGQ
jgi:membrane fusion protein, multidrug efflux system